MPKFIVHVEYTRKYEKELTIYANDEDEAVEKAEDIVNGWENVEHAEAVDVYGE